MIETGKDASHVPFKILSGFFDHFLCCSCFCADGGSATTPEGVGKVSFAISCAMESRPPFDKGVALLHSFQYEASQKVFRAGVARRSQLRDGLLGIGHVRLQAALGRRHGEGLSEERRVS